METVVSMVVDKVAMPAIFGLLTAIIGWAITKYVIPWLKTQGSIDKVKYAFHLVCLADDITDDWVRLKPNSNLAVWINEKVDELRDAVSDLKYDTARRVIRNAVHRKMANKNVDTDTLDKLVAKDGGTIK